MEASRQRLELPEEKMSKTIKKYGNTSSASIPMAMVEDLKQEKLKMMISLSWLASVVA